MAKSTTSSADNKEQLLESGLLNLFDSFIDGQTTKKQLAVSSDEFVEWLVQEDHQALLKKTNMLALEHCWGQDTFVLIDDRQSSISTQNTTTPRLTVKQVSGIAQLEKSLHTTLDLILNATKQKRIDRFPLVTLYDVLDEANKNIVRLSTLLMPYVPAEVANDHDDAVQSFWAHYFDNHLYAKKEPPSVTQELQENLRKILADTPDAKTKTNPVVNELICIPANYFVEIDPKLLYRGAPFKEELSSQTNRQWYFMDHQVGLAEARCVPTEKKHGFCMTYMVKRPLKLLKLTPETLVLLRAMDARSEATKPKPRTALHVALRVRRLLPENKELTQLTTLVTSRFSSVEIQLWDFVDCIIRERLMSIVLPDQFKCVPPFTYHDLHAECASSNLYTGKFALDACFFLNMETKELERDGIPAIECNIVSWLDSIKDKFDGLLIPPLPNVDGSKQFFPEQVALTSHAALALYPSKTELVQLE